MEEDRSSIDRSLHYRSTVLEAFEGTVVPAGTLRAPFGLFASPVLSVGKPPCSGGSLADSCAQRCGAAD